MTDALEISDKLFQEFSRLFFVYSGINLPPQKKYLIINRLQKFTGDVTGISGFHELYQSLNKGTDKKLIHDFVDALTTNYSYFFRDPVHFRFLEYLLRHRNFSDRKLRIWSAACSSGEEPYSIALTAQEILPNLKSMDFRILATDISRSMIEKAKSGIYRKESVSGHINHTGLKRYFEKTVDPLYLRIRPEIKEHIAFRVFNLLGQYPFKNNFDIVFLRNVLIYFDTGQKQIILEKIANYLSPGGYLVLGLSETLVGIKNPFTQVKYSIYRR